MALVTLLYLITSVQALVPIDDPDIWWRFRTGQWIVENHAVPLQDQFSIYTTGKPWIEYTWLFEVLVYVAHALFSLPGVVYFVVGAALSMTFVAHQLVRRFGLPLTAEVALVAVAMGAIKPLITPRPWLFTIILFAVEMLIIDRVRRSGKPQSLWVLPLVFALWANLHIQFVYGLAVLGLLLCESFLAIAFQPAGDKIDPPALAPAPLALVLVACVTATLLTPYHYLLYKQIFEYIGQTGAFANISELHPMFFRSPDSWLVLSLTLAAAFTLGWRRKWLPFPTLLLLMAAFLAFRARRDSWVLALAAVWIIGDSVRALRHGHAFVFSKAQILACAAAVASILLAVSIARQIFEANLWAIVEQKFPVHAVHYVKANRLPGPLFNDYDWGGFLLWSLPGQAVTIDGRLNLYGDEGLQRSLNTWQGRPGWNSDPALLNAKLIVADKQRTLVSLLRSHPRYKVAYEDKIAVVFVTR
jgi:hypothetical protein